MNNFNQKDTQENKINQDSTLEKTEPLDVEDNQKNDNNNEIDTSDQIIGIDPVVFYSLLAGIIIFIILIIIVIILRYKQQNNKK